MKSYHFAWLFTHPHRDEAWLRDKLRDGFDIHHLDGDHSNDDPANLVLIECADHMRLHGGAMVRVQRRRRRRRRPPAAPKPIKSRGHQERAKAAWARRKMAAEAASSTPECK